MACQSPMVTRTSRMALCSAASSFARVSAPAWRSTSTRIQDSGMASAALPSARPVSAPRASRFTRYMGCTVRWMPMPWRLRVMVVVSTRKGMSSFTISMMVWGLFQPSFFGFGLNTRTLVSPGRRLAPNSQWLRAEP